MIIERKATRGCVWGGVGGQESGSAREGRQEWKEAERKERGGKRWEGWGGGEREVGGRWGERFIEARVQLR